MNMTTLLHFYLAFTVAVWLSCTVAVFVTEGIIAHYCWKWWVENHEPDDQYEPHPIYEHCFEWSDILWVVGTVLFSPIILLFLIAAAKYNPPFATRPAIYSAEVYFGGAKVDTQKLAKYKASRPWRRNIRHV